jgi:predicted Zn-ribbon and HTH transcriptional regulator
MNSGLVLVCAVLLTVALVFIFRPSDERIRCQRCGYRGTPQDFRGGRCPGCGSLEM